MVGRPRHEDDDDNDDNRVEQHKKTKLLHQILEQQPRQQQQQQQQQHHENNSESEQDNEEEEDEDEDEAQPIGDVIRVSDDGSDKKNHFSAFEFDGNRFHLEDAVLVAPEEGKIKPSVTIIKDIFQTEGGSLMLSAQRLYRPEEAEEKGGGTWESRDPRELFYSCHLDEVPAYSVMHKCVVHVVPLPKPLPDRKQHPGFMIRKYYDYVQQKIRNLTEKDCKGILPQSAAA